MKQCVAAGWLQPRKGCTVALTLVTQQPGAQGVIIRLDDAARLSALRATIILRGGAHDTADGRTAPGNIRGHHDQ